MGVHLKELLGGRYLLGPPSDTLALCAVLPVSRSFIIYSENLRAGRSSKSLTIIHALKRFASLETSIIKTVWRAQQPDKLPISDDLGLFPNKENVGAGTSKDYDDSLRTKLLRAIPCQSLPKNRPS